MNQFTLWQTRRYQEDIDSILKFIKSDFLTCPVAEIFEQKISKN